LASGHPFETNAPSFGGSQTITFTAPVQGPEATFELDGYSTSGLDLAYASSNTSVATVSGSMITIIAAGNTNITANQPGDSHYTAASAVTRAFTVKQPQTITFTMDSQAKGTTVTLAGTASSSLAVSYAIAQGSSLLTHNTSTNAVTFTGTGQVIITASQAGNGTFLAAPDVNATFMVKKAQILVFQGIGSQAPNDLVNLHAVAKDSDPPHRLTGLPITFSVVSGQATIINNNKVRCDSQGAVVVRATQDGNGTYNAISADVTFTIGDGSLQGQEIIFPNVGAGGGMRHLPLGRKPFVLPHGPHAIKSNRDIAATLVVSQVNGGSDLFEKDGNKYFLKGVGFLQVTASVAQGGGYYAAADVVRIFEIKEPSRGAFFDERRTDDRHDAVKLLFKARMMHLRPSLSSAEALALFDEDSADSDGDGVSNLLERALGMDSLGPDSRKSLPRGIKKNDGKQRITFVRYSTASNTENISYDVEISSDLRVWTASGVSQEGSSIDVGGGMERVTYVTASAVSAGGRQYLRLTISAP
jgi:hypothetical protein